MFRDDTTSEARFIAQGQKLIIQDIGAFLDRVIAWFGFRGGSKAVVQAPHR